MKIKLLYFLLFFFLSHSFGQSWLGIVFRDQSSVPIALQHPAGFKALLIEKVVPGSGAVEAALQKGDLILGVGDKRLKDRSDLIRAVKVRKTGDQLGLLIGRGDSLFQALVELKKRPADVSHLTGTSIGSAKPYKGLVYANDQAQLQKPKAILLDFWATWCGPCRMTAPILDRLFKKYRSKGLEVMGISKEAEQTLKDFAIKYPVSYPLARDATGRISNQYGIKQIPTLFLLDGDGYILQVFYGVPDEKALGARIEELIF